MEVQIKIDWDRRIETAVEDAIDYGIINKPLSVEWSDGYDCYHFERNPWYVTSHGDLNTDAIHDTKGLVWLGDIDLPMLNKPIGLFAISDGYAVGLLLRVYPSTYRFSSLPNLELRDYAKIEAGWYPVRWISFR